MNHSANTLQPNSSGETMSKIMGFLHSNITSTTILYIVGLIMFIVVAYYYYKYYI